MPKQPVTGRTLWDVIAEIDDFYKWIIFVVIICVVCQALHIPF